MDVSPDELRARVGARIRGLLERRHMQVSELASAADVSRSHLHRIMVGSTAPSTDVLARIASALRVDPVELIRPYRKPPVE